MTEQRPNLDGDDKTPPPGEAETPEQARTETAANVRALRKHDDRPEPAS